MSDALAVLRRLRIVAGLIAEELDLEPDECAVAVNARGSDGQREVARISLGECFREADALLADPKAGEDGLSEVKP